MQEKRINDHWNVDRDRALSVSWTGLTKFTLLNEKPPSGKMWSGERLTQIADQIICGLRFGLGMSKAAKKQEKKEWAVEKPTLDNARKLRGIYFIGPEDREYKDTIKNARKKLETPLEAAMPCKMETRKRSKELRETVASETATHRRKPSMLVPWKLTNLQGSVCICSSTKIMPITLRRKDSIH